MCVVWVTGCYSVASVSLAALVLGRPASIVFGRVSSRTRYVQTFGLRKVSCVSYNGPILMYLLDLATKPIAFERNRKYILQLY